MKALWKRSLAIICVITLLLSLQGMQVFANELQTESYYEIVDSVNEDVISDAPVIDENALDAGTETLHEEEIRDAEDPFEDSQIEPEINNNSATSEYDLEEQPAIEVEKEEVPLVSASSNIVICGVDIGIAPGTFMQFQTKDGTNSNSGYYYKGYYLAASQCFGFARWCQYKLFGYHSASSGNDFYHISANGVSSISAGNLTTSNLKSMIQASKIGAHLRTNPNSDGTAHSMVITGISDAGFSIAQCNGSNNNEYSTWKQNYVGTYTYTWSSYVSSTYGKRGIAYIELPKNYPFESLTWARVTTDKIIAQIGENITFNLSSDHGLAYTIGIDDEGGNRIDTRDTSESHYTRSFSSPGIYSCYITAYDSNGLVDSPRIYFQVYNEAPKRAIVSLDHRAYQVGEVADFIMECDAATCYTIGIDDGNGNRIDTYDTGLYNNVYSRSFNTPGNYSCYITAYNNYGLVDSERIYFSVYDKKPQKASVSLDHRAYEVGEVATFVMDSDTATCYTIGIDDQNGNRIDTYDTGFYTNVYSRSFDTPGNYSCYITGYNNCGLVDSERIYFSVYKAKPSYVRAITEKEKYYTGESITIKCESDTANCYTIGIDDEKGNRVITYDTGLKEESYTFKLDKSGKYSCYITGYNNIGLADSARITFQVYVGYIDQDTSVTGISNKTYSGTAQTQNPTVKVGGKTLTSGTDYSLSYSNNTNVGKATVTITGKGNYSGSLSKTFTISAASILGATVTGISNKTYTGTAQTQNPTVKVGDKTLTSGTDYTLSYSNNTNAGTATVTITGKGNYSGNLSKTFTISAASISGATVTGISNKTYTGSAQTQSPTVKVGDRTLTNGTDYTLSYSNNTNAGTATVTIAGKGNYSGSLSKTFTISGISITGATVTGITNRTYTGTAQTQNPTVKLGEKTLVSGTDYTVSYANNTNAGTATVKVTGKGNYAGTVSKTFTISAASITGATVTGITNKPYTGTAQTQSPTVKLGEKTLASGTDYMLSYANNTNAGTATVTITGKGNYAGTISKTFIIGGISITGATVTGITNRTYTGAAQTQSPTVKLGEKTLASGTDYTLSYANNTNAGTATVKVTGKGNYTGTISKTFTINKATAKLTFASTSISKTTQDAAFINSLTKTTDGSVTFKSSNTAVAAVDPASGQVTIKGIGTATITVTAAEGTNYKAGSAGYTVTVVDGRTDISGCTVTLSPASYTYNGKERKPAVTVTSGTTTLTSGTDYTVTYTNNKTAGTATVTVTGKGSYTGTNSKTFKINKAAAKLTFAESSVSKKTTDEVFTNTLTKTTDGSVTFKSSNTAVAAVDPASGQVTIKGIGTATITVTAAEGTNYKAGSAGYTLTVVDGRTDISGCTVTLSPASYTYNGKERKPAVTVTSGTTPLTSGTDYTVTYTNNKNAGTATVTVTGKGSYTGTNSKTFKINKVAARLTFENANISKTTKDAAFTNALTKTTDGTVTFKSGNTGVATVNSTSGLVTIKGAGTATITATSSAGTNYKAGSASYTLTVTAPAPAGFSDVQDPSHPFYNAIYWAADAGITKGYPDGTFGIDRSCTRGEAVMFRWRMAGKPAPVESLTSPFSDVPQDHAFYRAILWASQRGITKGYSDGTFGINRTCTRGHIMTFIWRFKGQPTPKAVTRSPFSDVPMNHAYYKAILWGSQTGVTKGFSDGTFGINKDCTRGQIVTFLYRIK